MSVVQLTDGNIRQEIARSEVLVVEFGAPATSAVEELSRRHPDVVCATIDSQAQPKAERRGFFGKVRGFFAAIFH